MAAGNDTVNIRVKYIPDTSALKNIKEIKMPEIKVGGKDAGKGVFDSYNNAIRNLNRELSKGTDASAITKAFKTVGEETTKVKSQINSMKEAINQSFQSPSNQSLVKDYQNLEKQLKKLDAESQKRRKKSAELSSFKSQNNMSTPQARKEISKAESLVAAGEKLTKQDQERLEIAKQIIAQEEELAKLRTQEEIRNAQKEVKTKMASPEFDSMITNTEANRALGQYNDILSRVGINLNSVTGESKKFSSSLDEQVNQVKAAKKEVVKFGDIVSGTFLGTSLSNLFQTGLSRGIEFFKDYDEILTRTMMVTGQTREEVNSLTSSYNKLANQLSSTTKDVAAAQLVFYQQGLGTSEALKMTEASIAVSKTGGIDAAEAADRLTAAVRGYQLSANEAMDIADKMSALDAAAASSVDELTVAMQKSASQARMAGLDLDYYMAYLSTMQEVTREAPENIGTAMKSITSRLQEIKDIGKIEEDGTTFSNVAKALNSIGIAATDSSGQLRTLQDIMNELGPMWNTLDRNHKAYVATVLAGNRQQSRFIALMDNYDRAMELVNVSQNASGESAKQLRAYNQGLEASFTKLTNAWQQLATRLADSDMVKKVVDLLTSFIEVLNKIPKPITQTVIPLMALIKGFQLFKNVGSLFGEFKGAIGEKLGIDSLIKDTNILNKTMNSSLNIFNRFGSAVDKVFNRFKDVKNIKEASDNIKNYANENKALTASQINSNPAQMTEAALNEKIALTARQAEEAYILYNKALQENATSLKANDEEQYNEISSNLKTQKENLNNILKDIEDSQAEIDKKKKDIEKLNNKNIEEDFIGMSPNNRRAVGEKYLHYLSKDSGKSYQDILKEYKKNGAKLTGDTQKDILNFTYDNQDDIVNFLKEDSQKRIDILSEQLEVAYKEQSELFKLRGEAEQKLFKATQDVFDTPEFKRIRAVEKKNSYNKQKTLSIPDMKDILSEKDLGGFEKISTLFNKVNIGGGLLAGSLTQIGASFLGLDDNMSSTLGTTVGLATTFGKFAPPWGAIIGASLGIVKGVFDTMWPSVEKTKEKLVEYQQEFDKISQDRNDIESSLKVYEELNGKLNKTEEETQQLKDSTQKLAELIPGITIGYNEYGEAVINTAKAYEELDKKQKELSGNADKQLSSFTDLQKGAQKTERTWNVILKVVTAIGVAAAAFANPFTLFATVPAYIGGFVAWDDKISKEQIEENRKVFEENFSEIQKAYQTKRDAFLLEVEESNKDTSSKVIDSLINGIMNVGAKGLIEDYELPINELLNSIEGVDWSILDDARQHLENSLTYDEKTIREAKNQIDEEVREQLERAGLTDVQIDGIITAVLNITYEGAADADALKSQIDDKIKSLEVDGLTDYEKNEKSNLESMKKDIDNLTQAELELLATSGLLRAEYATLFKNAGGMRNFISKYKDENGIINKNKAIVGTINDLMEDRKKKQERINELNKENEQSDERQALVEYYKNKGVSDEEANKRIKAAEKGYNVEGGIFENGGGSDRKHYWVDGKDITLEKGGTSEAEKEFKLLKAYQQSYTSTKEELTKLNSETKIYNGTITDLISTIESYKEPTFGEMAEAIKDIQNSFEEISSLMESLGKSGNKFSFGDVGDLFSILDTYEKAVNLTDASSLATQNYFDALQKINDAVQVQNGQLIAQEGLEEGLYQLSIASAQAKMEEFYIQIEQTKQELEYQNAILATEKAAVDAALKELETSGKKTEAKKTLESTEARLETNLAKISVDTEKVKLEARLNAASQFAKKYAKIMRDAEAGVYESGDLSIDVDISNIKNELIDSINKSVEKDIDSGSVDDAINALRKRSESLQDQIDTNNKIINTSLELKEKISKYLSDPHNIGNMAQIQGIKDASDAQKDYNEKLERTLTLLEKIQGLQHKIDENETFKDLYKEYDGESYGRLLMSNLDLAQQQYEVYKDLFAMQQEMTNQAAGDLLDSPYGQMFKIQENGDIGWADLTMYDKYKNMPADMKEDIDNLVEAFQKQRDALRDTEKDMSKYAQEVKKVREELVQMQIEIENELVDAIKNREKILHDARIKALDDEIDMIEKAVEARKKAQEDDNSNKELYKAQEALRRATLDSSGKNNAQLLQLQQDLEDKQLEIAEKRFEDDMDDRKQWLQDTKDAETETYDYRLEKMTWYWEQVQAIQEAGTEAMMETLIHWNIEYAQTSEYQQGEMERKWKETMDAMKAATDMGAELGKMTSDIVSVTQTVEAMDIKIQALPGSWQKATEAANSYARAASAAWSAGNYYNNLKNKENPKPKNDKDKETTKPNPAPSPAAVPKEPGNLTAYRLKNNKLENTYTCPMPSKYDEGAVPLSVGATFRDKNGKSYYKGKDGFMYLTSEFKKVYKSGGYVDYTGPAWVDGNKTHPEAFLSAYQTEQIGALAKSLDPSTVNNATTNSNVTFGSINFNVASMSSAADGKKALDIFVQGANDMMAKKGIGTKLNINMK